jgi:carboxyl-terminal processing protease
MRRPWRIAAFTVSLLVFLGGLFVGDQVFAVSKDARRSLQEYTEILEAAHSRYGGEVTYQDLIFSSIQGMLRQLDPHSNFLSPEAYETMRDRQEGSFFGLGILVGMRDEQLTVISPLEGTPASRMGLRAGDMIMTIDGAPTADMTMDEAVGKLKGPKDTQVTITIVRPGVANPMEITITRAEIPRTTVRYVHMMADGKTGYMRITEFSRSTGKEVADAIERLERSGMERLLLDLRNNGGGLLDQAIEVADQFVPRGTLIVETRGRVRGSEDAYRAEGDHEPLDMPLVVLVNSGSASASEILSGAIQDHDVGIIVGTTTWGKGLVQTVYGLSYGSAIALTTARYYTPSGRLIQRDYSSIYDYYARSELLPEEEGGPPTQLEPAEPSPARPEDPTYRTDLGRIVHGGGGITPDVIVEAEVEPELLQFLRLNNAFFRFGVLYADRESIDSLAWRPEPAVLDEFQQWLADEDLGEPDEIAEAFAEPQTREMALNRIRAEVFNSAFDNDAWYQALTEDDHQIRAALRELERARDLLTRRLAADEDADRLAEAGEREEKDVSRN